MAKIILICVESQWHSLNLDDFDDYNSNHSLRFRRLDQVITFQTSDLIRKLYSNDPKVILPEIIDLESFDKQMSQEGKEFRESREWKALNFLRHHKIIDSGFDLSFNNFKIILEHLGVLYLKLLEKDISEKNRFEEIELKINKLIYRRQKKGIRINIEIAQKKCFEIDKEIYRLKNILQLEHNILTPENEKQQKFYLNSKKYTIFESLLYSFETRRNEDVVCSHFYDLLRNKQDLESLLYTISRWGGQERTYPLYVGFGTITSRIIMREPSLQNLRKVNRDVIISDSGTKLLYIDYSQFEAGILASLSDDEDMIALYNSDIYRDLAISVLGNENKREDAKVIFYRYMYGDDTLSTKAKSYFHKFKKLEIFRKNIALEISNDKKTGTLNGNFRCLKDDDHDIVWSLSHKIQATASLIYKNALIQVDNNSLDDVEFLIPMHDGTLYQIDEMRYEATKKEIEVIYIEEFKKICPKINPRVRSSELFQ